MNIIKRILTVTGMVFFLFMFFGCGDTTGSNVLPTIGKPTGLQVNVISSSRIDLLWNAVAEAVEYYVYRNGSYLKTVGATSTSDTGLSPSTQYCYAISAVNDSSEESEKCSSICRTTTAANQWTQIQRGINMELTAVAWDGSKYRAYGQGTSMLSSTDGVHWTPGYYSFSPVDNGSVLWIGDKFVSIKTWIFTSSNGTNWTVRYNMGFGWLAGICWSGSVAVVVGESGVVLTSPDGITWNTQTSGTTEWFTDVAWSGSTVHPTD
ncbi:MAG: fibronectin type III domain-containing protein [Spirochaetales bacterium]|nr:fibronectin type III domain-containing protein [Spirochaetales bacterium]